MPYKTKEARRAFYLKHRERLLARDRQYYREHRHEILAKRRKPEPEPDPRPALEQAEMIRQWNARLRG